MKVLISLTTYYKVLSFLFFFSRGFFLRIPSPIDYCLALDSFIRIGSSESFLPPSYPDSRSLPPFSFLPS